MTSRVQILAFRANDETLMTRVELTDGWMDDDWMEKWMDEQANLQLDKERLHSLQHLSTELVG